METIPLNPHAKPSLLLHTTKTPHPNPPIQIQLPLRRPEYKQPKPIRTKPEPVTTTSDILRLMDGLKLPIPPHMYASLVKECTETGDPLRAIELHEHMRKNGVRLSLHLLNRVLLMYVCSACYGHARQLFDEMFLRDLNSWAVVIAGCAENGEGGEAVELFVKMLREQGFENVGEGQMGFSVPGILVCVLKACLWSGDLKLGRQVHGWLWKMGFSENVVLRSFLIKFYGELKCYDGARGVFEQASYGNSTVVWTSRIVSCCRDDDFEEVVSVFKEMGREGVRKNGYTFSSVLKACRRMGDIGCGKQVHANVMKLGLESNDFVQCALVDLYGKCGCLKDASRAFEIGRNQRNAACCNAMLTNYTQHGLCFETIKILHEMKMAGFKPYESVFNEIRFAGGSRVPQNNMDKVYI